MDAWWEALSDLAIVLVFMVGIWLFRNPRTARSGNAVAALVLVLALAMAVYRRPVVEPAVVVPVLILGSLAGWWVALRVNMIQIPAMVALQNGAGGAAALLVSLAELTRDPAHLTEVSRLSGILGIMVGAVTLSGSMVAAGKLARILRQMPTILPNHGWLLAGLAAATVAAGIVAGTATGPMGPYWLLALTALAFAAGVVFSVPVGGADMPVLISFLNSLSGLAAALCGMVLESRLLIACGTTVAASGFILTGAMCRAMNRSLWKVFAPGGVTPAAAASGSGESQHAPAASSLATETPLAPEQPPLQRAVEAARDAQKVIIIPGYGMALAHAQFEVVKLAEWLRRAGKDVKFAIHPIAGRMPGHMHVLLAEAEADPDALFDLPDINGQFAATDLAIIVGACDVANPAAIHVEGTPISGMPILAAHDAKQVAVFNLDGHPGYSGVDNPLYTNPKVILVFGDAKARLGELLQSLG